MRSAAPTSRERDVLRLVALGYRNWEIAERLGISIRTVEAHRERGMKTIDASSRVDVVHWAMHNSCFTETHLRLCSGRRVQVRQSHAVSWTLLRVDEQEADVLRRSSVSRDGPRPYQRTCKPGVAQNRRDR